MTLTPVAASGPALVTFSVKVSFVPSAGVGLATVFRTETLAAEVGLTLAEEEVVPVGFGFVCDSVAVLVIVPEVALTVTVMVAVAEAPFARVPTVQVIVPATGAPIVPVALESET